MGILGQIKNSFDIQKLNNKELEILAEEVREKIIETVKTNGGHLSSNLGIVETTVALYKTFDFKKDKLIFDVGHQCYAHKILSDRKNEFSNIRQDGGISGFPDITESEYDAMTTGHAGTSISAGLGYCMARDKRGEDYTVISVVGDGSLSNGLNLEALFSSTNKPKNFIVILNDNGMSISKNKNGFYNHLSKTSTKRGYLSSKKVLLKVFGSSFITRGLARFRDFIKRTLNKNSYFENFGFKYVGVVDGNNVKEMATILERIKIVAKDKAVLLHVKTKKGKGLKEAEEKADLYHGVGSDFKCETGSFSLTLGKKLNALIEKDKSIMAITAGMRDGTGLSLVEETNPNNFVDVGIAEEYAVTLASGMALGGVKPIIAIYSTFLQRAYDQIVHDVCLQNLPVVFCIDRAGVVGKDGKTHQGVFDLSFLSHIPNMKILAPNSTEELEDALDYALSLNSPVAIRYPKNAVEIYERVTFDKQLWRIEKTGEKANILAVGPNMLKLAMETAKDIDGVGVISARTIKPLCEKTLLDIKDSTVIVLEENSQIGGFGSLVGTFYLERGLTTKVKSVGIKDQFIEHGQIRTQLEANGLQKQVLIHEINKVI